MPRYRTAYPSEFRRQMVDLVRSGRTPEELAREFEPEATPAPGVRCDVPKFKSNFTKVTNIRALSSPFSRRARERSAMSSRPTILLSPACCTSSARSS
jgi:hypothetical protein